MNESRWEKLADILVNYSTGTTEGDRVLITMMETDTWPLARAVHAAAIMAGAHPHIEFQSTLLQRDLMRGGDPGKFDNSHELQEKGMRWAGGMSGLLARRPQPRPRN